MANIVDPDQSSPWAVWSGSTLFAQTLDLFSYDLVVDWTRNMAVHIYVFWLQGWKKRASENKNSKVYREK